MSENNNKEDELSEINDEKADEILSKLPKDTPEEVKKEISKIFHVKTTRSIMPFTPNYMNKISENHITKILESGEKESERIFKEKKSTRLYIFIAFLIVFGSLILVLFKLPEKRTKILYEIAKYLLPLIAGFIAGWGWEKSRKN